MCLAVVRFPTHASYGSMLALVPPCVGARPCLEVINPIRCCIDAGIQLFGDPFGNWREAWDNISEVLG